MEEQARNNISQLLRQLHHLTGLDFSRQLEMITLRGEFHPVNNAIGVFSAIDERDEDFGSLLSAARRAVEHGYTAYILPNPKGFRTADFILVKKNVFKMYDLKTIQGKASACNRLSDSKGQTNRVLLYMATDYPTRLLASDIKRYFENNPTAIEVMIFKGRRRIVINRRTALDPKFFTWMRKMYE